MARKVSTKEIIATNLDKAIGKTGLGKNAIADKAGVSRSQLYDVLAARKAPTIDWLDRMSKVLDVETYALLRPGR
ncbi:MAG: helix-turn-helix transcriptional regulator [Clostridia bacterium]|nr:helix-turn-helix transcriptional regulator [Deltaproteobacteria bacterium]